MAIYVVMTLGTFAAILSMRRDGKAVETISDLAGLARTDPTMAFFLATMMFSLAGIPPLAGFFAKFYVFAAAIKAGLYGLAVIGVLASAVGAYYYLRIVKIMYFDEPALAFDRPGIVARAVLALAALLIIAFVFAPSLLTDAAMAAAQVAVLSEPAESAGVIAGWRVARLGAIDSTNEEARRRAVAGDPGRLWIVADEQTAGRGRRGRTWVSPRGNLYASALLIDPCPQAVAPQLGFVAGVALARAAADLGAAGARLKWPNDLVRRRRKMRRPPGRGRRCSPTGGWPASSASASIARSAPEGVGYPTCVLTTESGGAVDADALFERLVSAVRRSARHVERGRAVSTRSAPPGWRAAAALGGRIRIETAGRRREGAFEGLDGDGRLLFRGESGIETVESADLWILPAIGWLACGGFVRFACAGRPD